MPTKFKEGERVQVVDREATAEDVKSGLFYDYFRGLTGTIQKVYPTEEVAVELETESLSEAVAQRHHDVQEQMRTKWMDGLSEAERNRLSEKERDFRLRYTILVNASDLAAPGKKATTAAAPAQAAPRPTANAAAPTPKPPQNASEMPPRRTSADYDADEAAYLESRRHNEA